MGFEISYFDSVNFRENGLRCIDVYYIIGCLLRV